MELALNQFSSQTPILYIKFGCLVLRRKQQTKKPYKFSMSYFRHDMLEMKLHTFVVRGFNTLRSQPFVTWQFKITVLIIYYEQMFYCKFIQVIIRYSLLWFSSDGWLHHNHRLTSVWSVCISLLELKKQLHQCQLSLCSLLTPYFNKGTNSTRTEYRVVLLIYLCAYWIFPH